MGDNYFSEFLIDSLTAIQPPDWLMAISFIVSLISICSILFLNYRMKNLGKSFSAGPLIEASSLPPVQDKGIAGRWGEIQRHVQSEREAEWKFAIIEADKLVDDILSEIGVTGNSLGEKLTQINSSQLASIDDLWEAHKVRNKIAHDSQYFLRDLEARRIIGLFEKVLQELEAL